MHGNCSGGKRGNLSDENITKCVRRKGMLFSYPDLASEPDEKVVRTAHICGKTFPKLIYLFQAQSVK